MNDKNKDDLIQKAQELIEQFPLSESDVAQILNGESLPPIPSEELFLEIARYIDSNTISHLEMLNLTKYAEKLDSTSSEIFSAVLLRNNDKIRAAMHAEDQKSPERETVEAKTAAKKYSDYQDVMLPILHVVLPKCKNNNTMLTTTP